MRKTLPITAILLALGLMIHAAPTTKVNYTAPELGKGVHASVAASAAARCFDEVVWRAISNVADIEEQLPDNLATIEVEIRPAGQLAVPLQLVFAREALQALIAGKVAPERFIREYVRFVLVN